MRATASELILCSVLGCGVEGGTDPALGTSEGGRDDVTDDGTGAGSGTSTEGGTSQEGPEGSSTDGGVESDSDDADAGEDSSTGEIETTIITITGKGFGTKRRPGPLLFDDFEAGTTDTPIENQPAVVGTWQTGTGSEGPRYATDVVRTGTSASLHAFAPSMTNSSLAQNLEFTVAYLDYWTYVAPLDPSPEGYTRNFKPFRLYGASDALQAGTTTLNGNEAAIVYFDDVFTDAGYTEWFGGYPVGAWFHLQFWLRLDDAGQSNGVVRVRVDDALWGDSGLVLREGDAPMNEVRIGHYWATDGVDEFPFDNAGADVYVDDVYFDTTWSRVEVGDAPDYAAVSHREIQIVSSWTDTEITFELSKGTLAAGTAWAFAIGDDDSVLASKEIVVP